VYENYCFILFSNLTQFLYRVQNDIMWFAIILFAIISFSREFLIHSVCLQKSSSSNCRVGVINNPIGKPTEDNSGLYRALWASLLTQSNKNTLDFTLKLLKEENVELFKQGTKIKHLLNQVSGVWNTVSG